MNVTLIEATPEPTMTLQAALEWARQQITTNRAATVKFTLNGVKFELTQASRADQAKTQYEAILNSADNLVTG